MTDGPGWAAPLVYGRANDVINDVPDRCSDPDCDGDDGHDGPHFQWMPE